jgi:dTMP kinase
VDHLRAGGHDVLALREPGGTVVGEQIRALLIDPGYAELAPRAEMLLFAASRAQLVAEVVLPALDRGRTVVSERYVDASLAYQGTGRGLGVDLVRSVNDVATGGLRPDLTLLLDLDPETGLCRVRAAAGHGPRLSGGARAERWDGGDRLERESSAFHARVREGFLAIARIEAQRIRVIDARRGVAEVRAEIIAAVEDLLQERRRAGGRS